MKRLLAIAVLVAACAGGGSNAIAGTFALDSTSTEYTPTSCVGTGGYADVRDGLGVTVKDEAGKIIGSSSLALDTANSTYGHCHFTWSIPVATAKFYTITVGKRGDLTYSFADLVGRAWKVDATLGS